MQYFNKKTKPASSPNFSLISDHSIIALKAPFNRMLEPVQQFKKSIYPLPLNTEQVKKQATNQKTLIFMTYKTNFNVKW